MKTVMIVDDEKPARELLKMCIQWELAGYKIIAEAMDGVEALELYMQLAPDLIITDIQMPRMDGLTFIRELKRLNRDQNIIVLSCHENFNYAREVMKLGIYDYLIKDSLTPEDLYTVLKGSSYSKSELPGTSGLKSSSQEKKSAALKNLVDGRLEPPAFAEALETCNLCGTSCQYYFIHALVDGSNLPFNAFEVLEDVNGILTHRGGTIYNTDPSHYVILVITKSSHSELEMLNQRYTMAQSIRAAMQRVTGSIITAGVSRISSDFSLVREKNLEAQQALGYRVFLGKGKILYFDIIQNGARNIKLELIDTRVQNIKAALSQKNFETLSKELKKLYLSDLNGIMQVNYLQHVNALLLGILTTACPEFSIPYKSLFTDGTVSLEFIGNFETVEDMLLWFTEKFSTLINAVESDSNEQYSHQVRKIVQYIKQHYCDEIGLDSIAQLFDVHKVHLARIFKENTGFSVNGYIRELRIQEAKNLLKNTNLNISEIVYKVGFQNFQSFYTIFKKHAGVTPSEFRET